MKIPLASLFHLLLSLLGLVVLTLAQNFTQLTVGFFLFVLGSSLLLTGMKPTLPRMEAALKFFILGLLATGLIGLGTALLPLFPLGEHTGLLLVFLGFAFFLNLVPMQSVWPDVAEGAPAWVCGYLLGAGRLAFFVALVHVFQLIAGPVASPLALTFFSICSGLSLFFGSVATLPQRNLRRQLGYTAIAQSGFFLLAPLAGEKLGQPHSSAYPLGAALLAYLLTLIPLYGVITLLERRLENLETHRLAGLWRRSPWLAGTLALSLLSFVGLPPLAGFTGLWFIVFYVWNARLDGLLALAAFAYLALLYAFLQVVKTMFWTAPRDDSPLPISRGAKVALGISVTLLVLNGLWPEPLGWLSATLASPLP